MALTSAWRAKIFFFFNCRNIPFILQFLVLETVVGRLHCLLGRRVLSILVVLLFTGHVSHERFVRAFFVSFEQIGEEVCGGFTPSREQSHEGLDMEIEFANVAANGHHTFVKARKLRSDPGGSRVCVKVDFPD